MPNHNSAQSINQQTAHYPLIHTLISIIFILSINPPLLLFAINLMMIKTLMKQVSYTSDKLKQITHKIVMQQILSNSMRSMILDKTYPSE